jgi:hypothetical protein
MKSISAFRVTLVFCLLMATAYTQPWAIVNKASKAAGPPPLTSLTIPATGSGNLVAVALIFNGTTSVASISDSAGTQRIRYPALRRSLRNSSARRRMLKCRSGKFLDFPPLRPTRLIRLAAPRLPAIRTERWSPPAQPMISSFPSCMPARLRSPPPATEMPSPTTLRPAAEAGHT